MRRPSTFLFTAAVLLASLMAKGQTTPPAYTGPRYPGGPDSLRALIYRSTRLVPKAKGLTVVQLELKDDKTPANIKAIGDQPGPKSATGQANRAALDYLQAHMATWEPGAPTATAQAKPGKNPTFLIPLNFTAPLSAQPYAYADQEPVFPYLNMQRNQRNPAFDNDPEAAAILARIADAYNNNLASYIQRQTRYPAAALRNREQGRVTVYFEVAETGAVENATILTSAGGALDSEVRRAVSSLPPATTPALLNGRPVRVFYVVPTTFRIQ